MAFPLMHSAAVTEREGQERELGTWKGTWPLGQRQRGRCGDREGGRQSGSVVLGSLHGDKTCFVRAPWAQGDMVGVSPSEVSCWMKRPQAQLGVSAESHRET